MTACEKVFAHGSPPQVEFARALYCVTARGNAREPIYRDDADREAFVDLYAEGAERLARRCHAHFMMTNHYHWVVETRGQT